jgi:hypothetical protein
MTRDKSLISPQFRDVLSAGLSIGPDGGQRAERVALRSTAFAAYSFLRCGFVADRESRRCTEQGDDRRHRRGCGEMDSQFRRHWLQIEAARHPVCEAGVDPSIEKLQHYQAD